VVTTNGVTTVIGAVKLADFAALFQWFRFTKVALRILGMSGTTAVYSVMGYFPGTVNTQPVLFSNVLEAPWVSDTVCNNQAALIPSVPKRNIIPTRILLDQPVKWFRVGAVNATYPAQSLETQGEISFGSFKTATGASTLTFELEYTCEFKGFADPATVPMRMSEQKKEDDVESVVVLDEYESAFDVPDESNEDSKDDGGDAAARRLAMDPILKSSYVVGYKRAQLLRCKKFAVKMGVSVSEAKRQMGIDPHAFDGLE